MTIPQNGQQYTELHVFRGDEGKVTGTLGENITAHITHNQFSVNSVLQTAHEKLVVKSMNLHVFNLTRN
jgi:hypothetical protein